MNLLSISSDRKILTPGSGAHKKALWLAEPFDHTHVVMFTTDRSLPASIPLSDKLTIYPTRSASPWLYVWDGWHISRRLVAQHACSWVTTQDPFLAGIAGVLTKWFSKAQLHIQVHTDVSSDHFYTHSFSNKVRVWLAWFCLQFADRIRIVTARIAHWPRWFRVTAPASVLPVYFDPARYAQPSQKLDLHKQYNAQTILLCACRLEPEKNLVQIMATFNTATAGSPYTKLLIVGSGSQAEPLRAAATNSGLADRVIFVDWVENLPDYYHAVDGFINFCNYEGYGLTVAEAAAAGLPTITADVGLVGDVIEREHLLVCKVGDSQCLIGHIQTLLNNPTMARRKATAAQQHILNKSLSADDYLQRYAGQFS